MQKVGILVRTAGAARADTDGARGLVSGLSEVSRGGHVSTTGDRSLLEIRESSFLCAIGDIRLKELSKPPKLLLQTQQLNDGCQRKNQV